MSQQETWDISRREVESALRALNVACTRAKTGDRRAIEEGALALTRARKALQQMQGAGDAWVYGKLTAETGRLASDLERTALLLQAQPSPASTDPLSATEQDARARILRANQTLEQSNVYVRDTARLVVEARDVGVNTLGAMDEQREQLITAQRDIQDADGAMNSARQVLTRMAKRALVNKIFLWVVVLVLVLINVMFFYYAFLQK